MGKKPLKPPTKAKPPAPSAAGPSSPSAPKPEQPSASAASSRGRQGAPAPADAKSTQPPRHRDAAAPSDQPAAAAAPVAAVKAVPVTLVAPLFASCKENAVQLAPAAMRRAGIGHGQLARVASRSGVELLLVATKASTDVSAAHAVVHPNTLELLEGREGTVEVASVAVAELGRNATVVLHRLAMERSASEAAQQATAAGAQVLAAFSSRFSGEIVFDRMVAQANLAGITLDVRVELPRGHDVARITPFTQYSVVPLASAAVDDAEEEAGDDAAPAVVSSSKTLDTKGAADPTMPTEHELHVGDSGTGKSTALHARRAAIAGAAPVTCVSVDTVSLAAEAAAEAVARLGRTFAHAVATAPSLVVIDDVHLLCGTAAGNDDRRWTKRLVAAALGRHMDTAPANVRVLAAAASTNSVDRSLLRAGRFATVVEHQPPATAAERAAIISALVKDSTAASSSKTASISESCTREVAAATNGFVHADLASMVQLAKVIAFDATSRFVINDDALRAAARRTKPSALRNFDVSVPTVRWTDIGGSDEAKTVLTDCVRWCLGDKRELFDRLGLAPPRGVLLFGPPGCSKTMLAKALATESQLHFIAVKGPEVFSKWVGDSEKAVRDIFRKARAVAPCVVFIDELDGMCGHRGSGGVSDRVISQFLTELDGLPSAVRGKPDDVVFVAATNRPDNIDAAVLRPGRIDRCVYVGLPSHAERVKIAEIGLRGVPCDADVSAANIADRTEGYTGAEVIAVCKEAAFAAVAEDDDAERVCGRHVDAAFERTKPRVSAADVQWYKDWAAARSAR